MASCKCSQPKHHVYIQLHAHDNHKLHYSYRYLFNMQLITLLICIYCTEVHLSFCNYMNITMQTVCSSANKWHDQTRSPYILLVRVVVQFSFTAWDSRLFVTWVVFTTAHLGTLRLCWHSTLQYAGLLESSDEYVLNWLLPHFLAYAHLSTI